MGVFYVFKIVQILPNCATHHNYDNISTQIVFNVQIRDTSNVSFWKIYTEWFSQQLYTSEDEFNTEKIFQNFQDMSPYSHI